MNQNERKPPMNDIVNEALKKHFKHAHSIMPGFAAIELDQDLKLHLFRQTMHKGVYFMRVDQIEEYQLNIAKIHLHTLTMDGESLKQAIDEIEANPGSPESPQFEMEMVPIVPPQRAKKNEPLTLGEVAVWAAINDAEADGDKEKAHRIFDEAYSLGTVTEDTKKPALAQQDIAPVATHLQGVSKLSDSITVLEAGEDYTLDMSGKNEGRQAVTTAVRLDYKEQDGIKISRPMTAYDRLVQDSVATLWAAGNKAFTPAQVFRTMAGIKGKGNKPSATSLSKVEESIDKQFLTLITLDYSEEARGRELTFEGEPVNEYKIQTHMLTGRKETIRTAKGSEVVGYRLLEAPILYRHDMATKQIISYPQTLLEKTSTVVSNTPRNMLIRAYLIKRTRRMKANAPRELRCIQYSTLYEEIGEADAGKKARQAIRESAAKLLDSLIEEKEIKGWKEYTNKKDAGRRGTAKTGIEITPIEGN